MSLKVVHVVRQYHPSIGGMEEVVQNIAHEQREQHDHRPTIITLDRLFKNPGAALAAEEWVHGVPVVRLPYSGSSRYPLCPAVLERVRDADLIHVHGIDFFFDYLAATKRIHRRPLVVSTHGGFFHTRFVSTFKKIYFNSMTRISARAYSRVIATSHNDGEIFSEIVPPPKMMVIENGVNVTKYRGLAAPALSPTLIYFGRWSENKGLHETITFFRDLVARHPEWRLIIAGREYDHSEAQLLAWAHQYGLTEKIRVAPNPTDKQLAELIGQASYFICLSRHEGFGIAPIEALSAGLTPVLSDIPPFRNLLTQSGLGILRVARDSGTAITELIATHQQGADAYLQSKQKAQAFVERYNWRHIANKYVDVYTELAEPEARRVACM